MIVLSLNTTVVSLALPNTKLIGTSALIFFIVPAFSVPDANNVPCSSRTSYQDVPVNLITNASDELSSVLGVSVAVVVGDADDAVDEGVADTDEGGCVVVEVMLGVFVNWFNAILSMVLSGWAGSELMVSRLLMAPEDGSVICVGADVTLRSWSILAHIK